MFIYFKYDVYMLKDNSQIQKQDIFKMSLITLKKPTPIVNYVSEI